MTYTIRSGMGFGTFGWSVECWGWLYTRACRARRGALASGLAWTCPDMPGHALTCKDNSTQIGAQSKQCAPCELDLDSAFNRYFQLLEYQHRSQDVVHFPDFPHWSTLVQIVQIWSERSLFSSGAGYSAFSHRRTPEIRTKTLRGARGG